MMSETVRRIAILAPMPSELRPLLHPLGLVRSDAPGQVIFRGGSGALQVVAARTGVGMRAAAACAARVLDATSPDHLVVVGIAGAIGPQTAVGDLVVPALVLDLDAGGAHRATQLGDVAPRGTLASSDRLLASPEQARPLAQRGVVAIDMETAAIAAVCDARGCPWSVFRAASDRADDGSTDAAILRLLGPDGRPRASAVTRFVATRPQRIPQLVRLARGAHLAAHTAARAALAAIRTIS